jgi:putative acetyltransferase
MLIIRTEGREDYEQVHEVNIEAFEQREDEALLVRRIRDSGTFVPELSIVAEQNGKIVGHLLMSKSAVHEGRLLNDGQSETIHEVVVLAPIAVRPDYQGQGVGKHLIREGLKRCSELGFELVLLIGHPGYYPKFGFMPARPFGLELTQFTVPDEVFMVCELREGALNRIQGELRYPDAFFDKE